MFLERKPPVQPGAQDAFRFDSFFFHPWRGHGVIRDRLGLKKGSYDAQGRGRIDDGRIFLEHTHTFNTGLIHRCEWEIVESNDGRIVARENALDILGQGWQTEQGFRWTYTSRMPTSFGLKRFKTTVLYTLNGAGRARSSGSIGLWGMPLTTISGEFQHVD